MDVNAPGILIVEDDDEIRRLLALVLRLEGYRVDEAADGNAALEQFIAERERIAMVLTDLGLPGLGGLDLIRALRDAAPGVPIVGASGFGHANMRDEVLAAGGTEFLSKPFVTGDLVALVRRLAGPPDAPDRDVAPQDRP